MNAPWVPLFFALILLADLAAAAPSPKGHKLEQYPAIDPAVVLEATPAVQHPKLAAPKVATPTVSQPPVVAQLAQAPQAPTKKFDAVPSQHVESIALRLQLVEQILRKHGRAYDYRVHSTRELRGILKALDQSAAPQPEEIPLTEESSDDNEKTEI
jgi:hypothetical protein